MLVEVDSLAEATAVAGTCASRRSTASTTSSGRCARSWCAALRRSASLRAAVLDRLDAPTSRRGRRRRSAPTGGHPRRLRRRRPRRGRGALRADGRRGDRRCTPAPRTPSPAAGSPPASPTCRVCRPSWCCRGGRRRGRACRPGRWPSPASCRPSTRRPAPAAGTSSDGPRSSCSTSPAGRRRCSPRAPWCASARVADDRGARHRHRHHGAGPWPARVGAPRRRPRRARPTPSPMRWSTGWSATTRARRRWRPRAACAALRRAGPRRRERRAGGDHRGRRDRRWGTAMPTRCRPGAVLSIGAAPRRAAHVPRGARRDRRRSRARFAQPRHARGDRPDGRSRWSSADRPRPGHRARRSTSHRVRSRATWSACCPVRASTGSPSGTWELLCGQPYTVADEVDRVGCRLRGPVPLTRRRRGRAAVGGSGARRGAGAARSTNRS